MCGILVVYGSGRSHRELESLSERIHHRGPDERDIYINEQGHALCHQRLSIVGVGSGKQPIQGTSTAYMVHNGEIYNHQKLRDTVLNHHTFRTFSDSEVIVHMYEEFGEDFIDQLDGVFSFAVLDGERLIVARDPIGVKPLYYGRDKKDRWYFSSEMKCIVDQCISVEAFPPGHYYTPEKGFVRYYQPTWFNLSSSNKDCSYEEIRSVLKEAVEKRLMGEVPIGVLLSGGLDSSLVSSITSRVYKQKGQVLHSFSVGVDSSAPDLVAANRVADFIGSEHHEIIFTVEQGISVLEQLIWYLETYDVTSIRASTPMYLLSKEIKKRGIKVVLSGEGADEIFGGYLYFKNAPSLESFQKETIERVLNLSTADCLRADKSTMANGLEARVPFLDKKFLELAIGIAPKYKSPATYEGIEKFILRKAFDVEEDAYLPKDILWRQKEQFSDGVGYSWIDSLIAYAESKVSDKEMTQASECFPIDTPLTKEAYFYRTIFAKHFPQDSAAKTVRKWIPKWQDNEDPSGRANKDHLSASDAAFTKGVRI